MNKRFTHLHLLGLLLLLACNSCGSGGDGSSSSSCQWKGPGEYKDLPFSNSCYSVTTHGLGKSGTSPGAKKVFVSNGIIYAATWDGLSISTDGGKSFITKTTSNGLISNYLYDVFVVNDRIYVATSGAGISISLDGGNTFTNTPYGGEVYCIVVSNNIIYAGTDSGLMISNNNGTT